MSVDSINRSLFFPFCRLDDPTSEMRFDNFSQIDGLSTNNPVTVAQQPVQTVMTQPTGLNNMNLANRSMVPSNVTGGTVVAQNSNDPNTVKLETNDGFYTINATGNDTAVAKVFKEL